MSNPVVELLWFEGCPNHAGAEALLRERMARIGISSPIVRIEVPDEASGIHHVFPGSPTIRVNGRDVEPGWAPCADCTPRCRLYATEAGLRGLPEASWIDRALAEALAHPASDGGAT